MEVTLTVLMVGLPASGKTTIIRSLCNRKDEIFPTAGFEISYVNVGVRTALVYDCSGEGHSRETWELLYDYCDAVCFVIDAQDTDTFSIAKQTLHRFLESNRTMKYNNCHCRKKCLAIMLNKCDLPAKVPKDLFFKALEMEKIQKLVGRVYMKESSAYTKEGLD